MPDTLAVIALAALFSLAVAYVHACDLLKGTRS
jgi:hypothetical protein